jgi:hypothetical protein
MSFGNPVSGSLSPGNAMTKLAYANDSYPHTSNRGKGSSLQFLFVALTINLAVAAPALALDPPTFNLNSGTYTARPSLVITPAPGAVARFTDDGSPVTTASPQYTTPITISLSRQIRSASDLSGTLSAENIVNLAVDQNSIAIPRNSLSLWLRGDFGPEVASGKLSKWNDVSGANPPNDAAQASSGSQPDFGTAINYLGAAKFDGTNDWMTLSNSMTDLTAGASVFAVIKPESTSTGILMSTSANAGADRFAIGNTNTQALAQAYSGSTASSVTSPNGSLVQSKFQIVDYVHDGAGNATININGEPAASEAVQNLGNTSRALNFLGSDFANANLFKGQLAEILVYQRKVSEAERGQIVGYLYSKYQLDNAQSLAAPIISVPSGSYDAPMTVAIAADPDAVIRYSTDGSTPTISSPEAINGQVRINFTTTLKAIAFKNGITSGISTSTITLDPVRWPAPDPSDHSPLHLNLTDPTFGVPIQ